MPVIVIVSALESEALAAGGVAGLNGSVFTYEPRQVQSILGKLDSNSDARVRLAGRLGAIATQIGVPNTFFTAPVQTAPAPEPVVEQVAAAEPDAEAISEEKHAEAEEEFDHLPEEAKEAIEHELS